MQTNRIARFAVLFCLSAPSAYALDLNQALQQGAGLLANPSGSSATSAALDNTEVAAGLKEALAQGVESAIGSLGKTDGFLGNDLVRIALPDQVTAVADLARKFGAGSYVDNFETSMNRAAEKAVVEAAPIFGDAIRNMTIEDAQAILAGGDTAATDYLRKSAGDRLVQSFRPVVEKTTSEAGVTAAYKQMVAQAGPLASLGGATDLDAYVTEGAVDGLFTMIAKEEQAIRANPMAQTSDLLQKVFGSQ